MPVTDADNDGMRPVDRFEWERVVRRARIGSRVKVVALVLATYADANGSRVRPGVDVLASDTELSTASVKRSIAALRDTYRLIEQVARGGGRDGRGRAAEYRLVFPLDLLERIELTPVGPKRGTVSRISLVSPQNDEPPANDDVSGLTAVSPEGEESGISIVIHENDFQGSEPSTPDSLRDQKSALRDHPGDPLPSDQPPKEDHEPGCAPTEPPTAREPPRPAKCPHGLPSHLRTDGKPTCPICRRGLPGKATSTP